MAAALPSFRYPLPCRLPKSRSDRADRNVGAVNHYQRGRPSPARLLGILMNPAGDLFKAIGRLKRKKPNQHLANTG